MAQIDSARRVGLALALVLALVVIGRAGALADEGPAAVVENTIAAVTAVLTDKSLSADAKRQQIEQIVYARFDFEVLSKLVLARHWKALSSDQQREFVEEFKRHLSVTYGKNVESYNDERAVTTGSRQEKNGDWTVKSKVVRKNAPEILIDYRLRQAEGRWQVIDVVIEGVSLVANFRSQFQEVISQGGPTKLIQQLKDKNARGEGSKLPRAAS